MKQKTKFSPLIKIKKTKLEELNAKLLGIRDKISKQRHVIATLKEEFYNSTMPREGKIGIFAARQLLHVAFKQELNVLESEFEDFKSQESAVLSAIKQQHIELEKFKILHQDEINKKLKILKRKEDNFMDEIGNIRHTFLGMS